MSELTELPERIDAEAERIRTDGTLPPGFEAEARARFEAIAADPKALEDEVARRHAHARAVPEPAPAASRVRRRIGPPLRAVQRAGVERLGRSFERVLVREQVLADRARRIGAGTKLGRARSRFAAGVPGAGERPSPISVRIDPIGHFGDLELDSYVEDHLRRSGDGTVLQVEAGDGALVDRLRRLGVDARGHDPHVHTSGSRPLGALEAIAAQRRSSIGALLLTGVTDRLTPASARALSLLASSVIAPAGLLVLVSAHPDGMEEEDPVAFDLELRRPLRPATWCLLLARSGFEEIDVREAAHGLAYAVSARRSRS